MSKKANLTLLRWLTHLFVPPYERKTPPSKTVAVVVPLSARDHLLPDEQLSLRHLFHFLGPYDKYFIAAQGSSAPCEGLQVLHFPCKFFGSAAAHNRLLMWPPFYRTFEDYTYILMYHLDSLVLSEQIMPWCQTELDYVGAPWLPCSDTPWVTEARVGNGGFALMKVESVLKVLHNRYRGEPATFWVDLLVRNHRPLRSFFRFLAWLQRLFPESRTIRRPTEDLRMSEEPDIHGCNNDYFWSFHAVKYLPEFKVAGVEDGLRFAFEAAPRSCLELNRGQMPFGCHAWMKFDREFWEPHLLKPGLAGE